MLWVVNCGTVGRAVASEYRGPEFESVTRDFKNTNLLSPQQKSRKYRKRGKEWQV